MPCPPTGIWFAGCRMRILAMVAGAVVALAAMSAQAVTLDVRQGRLFGASGVVVGGVTFDVAFVDGSCIALFDGCDGAEDFDFISDAAADVALQALADQVFVDGPAGQFDSDFALTNGCSSTSSCAIFIPVSNDPSNPTLRVAGRTFFNVSPGSLIFGDDFLISSSSDRDRDLTTNGAFVFAQFTQVPLPAALPLMMGGLGVLALVGRRRRG